MCGISGIVGTYSNKFESNLIQMIKSTNHRGPDGNGKMIYENCIFGHNRLSIIDLVSGSQPMRNGSGRIAITFNGEIYGYKNIKEYISDYDFKTTSDTEVILALYEKHNEKLVNHLPGMFSFAIWDDDNQKLFCARDRFGEKPFYYSLTNEGNLIFASEVKAILSSGLIEPALNLSSIGHFIQRRYIHPLQTIYSNIFTLPPGHYLVFKNGKIEIKRYFFLPKLNYQISLSDAIDGFKEKFSNSIKKQLIADVEVGAFLSGGLDSSSIVAVASEYKKNLKTYSFGLSGQLNELPIAKEVANTFKTDHYEFEESNFNIAELLIEMQTVYDEPFADTSMIPTYLISKAASEHVKVVLTGDGGDELLGGYTSRYLLYYLMQESKNKNYLDQLVLFLFSLKEKLFNSNVRKHRDVRYALNLNKRYSSIYDAFLNRNSFPYDSNNLFGIGDKYKFAYEKPFWQEEGNIEDIFREDLTNYMPGDILVKTDRASMANSLELRAPFLDKDFSEFVLSLPPKFKINGEKDKIILRNAYKNILPDTVLNRPKHGFGAFSRSWLSISGVNDLNLSILYNKNSKIYDYFDFKLIRKGLEKKPKLEWSWFILSLWLEQNKYI